VGRAKDNAASCARGPFVRLVDELFGLYDIRNTTVTLTVDGDDGLHLEATSSMSVISRDIVPQRQFRSWAESSKDRFGLMFSTDLLTTGFIELSAGRRSDPLSHSVACPP